MMNINKHLLNAQKELAPSFINGEDVTAIYVPSLLTIKVLEDFELFQIF